MLREYRPTTLSHSVPSLTSKLRALRRALARKSVRRTTSWALYVFQERPQEKGFREAASGRRPYFSLDRNSPTVMESGTSGQAPGQQQAADAIMQDIPGKGGTQGGGWKTMARKALLRKAGGPFEWAVSGKRERGMRREQRGLVARPVWR